MPVAAIAPIIGAAGAAFKIGSGIVQNSKANGVTIPEANYSISPFAKKTLAMATQMNNGPMAGKAAAEDNLQTNNANTNAAIDRTASDGGQALAIKLAAAGQTNQSITNLGLNEANYRMNTANMVSNANQGMTSELDKVYQDEVMKRQQAIGEKNALRGAGMTNIGTGINEATNLGYLYDMMKKQKSG